MLLKAAASRLYKEETSKLDLLGQSYCVFLWWPSSCLFCLLMVLFTAAQGRCLYLHLWQGIIWYFFLLWARAGKLTKVATGAKREWRASHVAEQNCLLWVWVCVCVQGGRV